MRPQELNMLMVFDAIMTEGSITRAANRLSMTQPAVSNTVSRMRAMWKDEVFIRNGRNIQPTLFANNLWQKIQDPLRGLASAIDPATFEPQSSDRTFRIGTSGIVIDIAWRALRKVVEAEAPNINIYAHPLTTTNGGNMLDDAEVDLVVGTLGLMPENLNAEFIFDSHFVCIMRKGHPLEKCSLTLEEFAAAEHLLVSLSGDIHGVTDQELERYDLKRRVAMTVNDFSSAIPLVIDSDLIAILPSSALGGALNNPLLSIRKPPVSIPESSVNFFWHKRQEADLGLIWLKEKLRTIFLAHIDQHHALLRKVLHCK